MTEEQHTQAIAQLNDQHRAQPGSGWVFTIGVQDLDDRQLAQAINAVRGFAAFTEDNDPHGEHDFGQIEVDGHRLFWKIDYYDRNLRMASPDPADPADPAVTRRMLTVMLAEEY